jgi:probable F420-dependent oxidoreductase
MRFGFVLPNLLSPVPTSTALKTSARLAEAVGFDSIWATDHILMPEEHPRYGEGTEALVTLAYLASATQRVQLGLSVLVLPMRNPIIAAKQIASIIHLSGREIIVGVGVGWNEKEYGYLNANFKQRGRLVDEYIAIMQTLWTQEKPAHDGTYTFSSALFAPRPKTPPPIWIGGESDAALKRAARVGAGYQPNYRDSVEKYAAAVKRIRELSEGKPITMSVRISFNMHQGAAAVIDQLGKLREAGLEYPAVGFRHESLSDLVSQIEVFGRDVIPQLRDKRS